MLEKNRPAEAARYAQLWVEIELPKLLNQKEREE
jgi:hypothetical protein